MRGWDRPRVPPNWRDHLGYVEKEVSFEAKIASGPFILVSVLITPPSSIADGNRVQPSIMEETPNPPWGDRGAEAAVLEKVLGGNPEQAWENESEFSSAKGEALTLLFDLDLLIISKQNNKERNSWNEQCVRNRSYGCHVSYVYKQC